jgi:very-short-patch-repair endonuclease
MHITRKLRKDLTSWERKLWQILRNRGFKKAKFRRQFKIGPYVVDFCCLDAKLVIELDGGHHSEDKHRQIDLVRQKYLENLGFTVLRFWNNDIDSILKELCCELNIVYNQCP